MFDRLCFSVLLWSGILCTGTKKTDVSPGSLRREAFQKATLLHSRWHQKRSRNQANGLTVRNWTSIWGATRSTRGASPLCLGGRTGKNSRGIPASVRQVNSGEGRKLGWKTCFHPHLEQGGMSPVGRKGAGCCFFLSYSWELTISASFL